MARLGRSSVPMDLMTYTEQDRQPGIFLLKESGRQSVLTVFNWSDGERARSIDFVALGLKEPAKYRIVEVFGEVFGEPVGTLVGGKPFGGPNCCAISGRTLELAQRPHSVRVLKLIDESVPLIEPRVDIRSAASAKAGENVSFGASPSSGAAPVLACHWDFGDGSSSDGMTVTHTFTHAGDYAVRVTATGLGATTSQQALTVPVTGEVSTQFDQARKLRPE
jgi:hypothetical protein